MAEKKSYFSKIRQALVPTYLFPYSAKLLSQIHDIQKGQESKRLHLKEGYYTVAQLCKLFGISRKTLERWDKAQALVPTRINGIRYYTEDNKDKIPDLLQKNNSPKIRALLSSHKLALT